MPILGGCCCCDLQVGTKIIGALHLIEAILGIISTAGLIFFMEFLGKDVLKSLLQSDDSSHHSITVTSADSNWDEQQVDKQTQEILNKIAGHVDDVMIYLYVTLAICVLTLVTSSLLIHGVRTGRRGMLLPWIIVDCIALLLAIALIVLAFVFFGVNLAVGIFAVSMAVAVLIQLYFILVVISQYQALGLIRMHEEISMK